MEHTLVTVDNDRLEPVSKINPILNPVSQLSKQAALTKNRRVVVSQMVVHVVLGSWNVAEQRFWIGFLIWTRGVGRLWGELTVSQV